MSFLFHSVPILLTRLVTQHDVSLVGDVLCFLQEFYAVLLGPRGPTCRRGEKGSRRELTRRVAARR
jgi:hypothetical protein